MAGSGAANTLRKMVEAEVFEPGEHAHHEVCAIWPKSDLAPQAVIRCRGTADVQAAVRAARDLDVPLSVRAGGHDWAGRALCDGIVLDLRGLGVASVDPASSSVVVGGLAGHAMGGSYGPLLPGLDEWITDTAEALGPHRLPGGYAPFLAPDDHAAAAQSFGANAMRLRTVKATYDPDTVFNAIPLPR